MSHVFNHTILEAKLELPDVGIEACVNFDMFMTGAF